MFSTSVHYFDTHFTIKGHVSRIQTAIHHYDHFGQLARLNKLLFYFRRVRV
jgi:hypothetical protein